jgi:hypothetical protein
MEAGESPGAPHRAAPARGVWGVLAPRTLRQPATARVHGERQVNSLMNWQSKIAPSELLHPYALLASLALLGSVGCGGTGDPVTSTSSLPGVHFEIDASVRTFSRANGKAKIPYTTVIDHDIDGVTPLSQTTDCLQPAESGLFQLEGVDGNGQSYSIWDTGYPSTQFCSGAITLKQGRYPNTFTWDFSNWDGPSDDFNPPGPPFPPGDYTFSVDATGTLAPSNAPFEIRATLGIHVVP